MSVVSSKVIAACFSLSAFAVAIISGLVSENPSGEVLWRALVAMFVCYPVGLGVGLVCERLIMEHVREHERSNPAPDSVNHSMHAASSATSESAPLIV